MSKIYDLNSSVKEFDSIDEAVAKIELDRYSPDKSEHNPVILNEKSAALRYIINILHSYMRSVRKLSTSTKQEVNKLTRKFDSEQAHLIRFNDEVKAAPNVTDRKLIIQNICSELLDELNEVKNHYIDIERLEKDLLEMIKLMQNEERALRKDLDMLYSSMSNDFANQKYGDIRQLKDFSNKNNDEDDDDITSLFGEDFENFHENGESEEESLPDPSHLGDISGTITGVEVDGEFFNVDFDPNSIEPMSMEEINSLIMVPPDFSKETSKEDNLDDLELFDD